MEPNLEEQGQKLIEQLSVVRNAFIDTQKELAFSIRKDVVAAELRDMLDNNPNFYELKTALESYIDNLLKIENMGYVNEGKQG